MSKLEASINFRHICINVAIGIGFIIGLITFVSGLVAIYWLDIKTQFYPFEIVNIKIPSINIISLTGLVLLGFFIYLHTMLIEKEKNVEYKPEK